MLKLTFIPVSHGSYTPETSGYGTRDEAFAEWCRRRSDWTGQYPAWGDGGPDVPAVEAHVIETIDGADVATETVDAWTPADLCDELNDLAHYYDN